MRDLRYSNLRHARESVKSDDGQETLTSQHWNGIKEREVSSQEEEGSDKGYPGFPNVSNFILKRKKVVIILIKVVSGVQGISVTFGSLQATNK